jgi:uncharacterized protein DUF3887
LVYLIPGPDEELVVYPL